MRSKAHARNRRGEGGKLRDEIVAASAALLEETGDESALTLRAVARRVGIAAPSIYSHFGDREAIFAAVVDEAFAALVARLRVAIEAEGDPVGRLRAGCSAYVAFAAEQPQRYRVLFQVRPADDDLAFAQADSVEQMVGAEAFGLLVRAIQECVDADRSTAPSPQQAAIELWVAMHGYVTLRAGAPAFPWPEPDGFLDGLLVRLAFVDA